MLIPMTHPSVQVIRPVCRDSPPRLELCLYCVCAHLLLSMHCYNMIAIRHASSNCYWGERERAPTWWSQRDFCTIYIHNYIYIIIIGERERANLVVQLARFFYISTGGRVLHIPYISKCFYALLFHRHLSTFHGTHLYIAL